MNTTQTVNRIHPLIAVAALAVTLVSFLGIAALSGVLPSSHGSAAIAMNQAHPNAPVLVAEPIAHKPHAHPSTSQVAHTEVAQLQAPATLQQKPTTVPHNSPVGIGIGAVIGGLLGNQVGRGDGKTLATIAGAVGGGYVGNEVAKRNQ